MRTIEVRPLAEGWRVAVAQVVNDMVFKSGRDAEDAARRLAERLGHCGEGSEIRIFLRDGSPSVRFLSPVITTPDDRQPRVVSLQPSDAPGRRPNPTPPRAAPFAQPGCVLRTR